MDIHTPTGPPESCKVGLRDSEVVIKWDKPVQGIGLNWKEAQKLALAIFRQAHNAEQKERAALPTNTMIENFTEQVFSPTLTLAGPGLTLRDLARGKRVEP